MTLIKLQWLNFFNRWKLIWPPLIKRLWLAAFFTNYKHKIFSKKQDHIAFIIVATYSWTSGSDGCSDASGGEVTLSAEPTVQGGTEGGGASGWLTAGGDWVCLPASSPTGDGFVVTVIHANLLCNTNTTTFTTIHNHFQLPINGPNHIHIIIIYNTTTFSLMKYN